MYIGVHKLFYKPLHTLSILYRCDDIIYRTTLKRKRDQHRTATVISGYKHNIMPCENRLTNLGLLMLWHKLIRITRASHYATYILVCNWKGHMFSI